MSNSCGSEGLIERAAAQYAARYALLSDRADGTYRLIVDVVVRGQVVEVEVKWLEVPYFEVVSGGHLLLLRLRTCL